MTAEQIVSLKSEGFIYNPEFNKYENLHHF